MPRPEDIAWKFVLRLEGKRWRCPYCHKESSGSVTRVKSHFLKQAKEGIAYCTKVPEHIRTLMELLLNHEVRNKEDIAWKFVNRLEDSKWRCHYCSVEFSGDLTGLKGHLLGVPNEGTSICTQVLDHARALMLLLLDEVAEEESREVAEEQSREAHGQSSIEPNSRDMPSQAEVAEEEIREANRQFSTEPQSPDMLSPAVPRSSQSLEDIENLFTTTEGATDLGNLDYNLERQFYETLAMPPPAQNIHGESLSRSTMALAEGESFLLDSPCQPQCSNRSPYPEEMQMNDHRTPAGALSFQYVPLPAVGNSNCFQDCNDSQLQTPVDVNPSITSQRTNHITGAQINDSKVPEAATNTMGPSSSQEESREVAEGQSREANRQSFTEPQSRDMPTHAEVEAEEESREANGQFSTGPLFSPGFLLEDMEQLNFSQQDVIWLNSAQQSQRERQFHQSSTMPSQVQNSHVQPVLVAPQHQNAPRQSEIRNVLQNPTAQSSTALRDMDLRILSSSQASNAAPQWPTDVSNFNQQDINELNSGQQSQAERQFPQSSTMPSLAQNSHGESSMMASTEEVPNSHNLLCQPHCCIQSQIQMNDQHTSDSHIIEATTVDSQVPEVATNGTGPSSSQDMNRGSPVMDVRSIYANDEEIRNLKRKVEELDDKEAVIKEQMEIESAASSVQKKPRILVERWLKETERARNNFQIIGQANAEILPPKEKVETLTREVEELIEKTLPQTLLIEERDAKGVKFLEQKLTGEVIHRNIELIWDRLKENHACKLGICGMGGVGKTTIMMHIHNRLLEDATFDGVVFITVSQDFSIKNLQSDIWKALEFGVMKDEHEKKRAAMLSEQLERKKNCVLILDDVWERLDLEEVGIPVRADGCKLVLTTRSFDVCCQMHCQEKIKIEPLSQIEAESLFLEELGSEVPLNSETKAIVKSIVEECAGLPIGVITMARSMRGVTDVFEWRDSLVKLEESSKGQTDMEKKVLMNLKFSYDRLGNPDVQQCFLSCALYPEDELIDKFELVEFFIDQGLVGGLNTRREQYDRGLTILNKLRNVCLLEDHGSKMKMHDLIRDMALHIMSVTSIVKAGKRLESIPSEEYWTDALEKVSLMRSKISKIPLNMSPNCPKLSTLLLNESLLGDVVLPDSFFKQLCGLKVLNLSGCELTELPNSISDLVNLRALLLRGCWGLCHIPYLGKLTSLRKLDVGGCSKLKEVPEGLEMLVNLRYLEIFVELPERVLEGLLNLQHLKVDFLDGQDMTKLRALETLECSFEDANDFNKYVRVIEQSNSRCYYSLCYYLDRGDKYHDEEYCDITQIEYLKREVNIWGWDHAIVSVGGECTSIFILIPQNVQKMAITCCNGITSLSSIGPLEYLEELYIGYSENLGVLYRGEDEEVIDIFAPALAPFLFSSLRVLTIYYCPKLKYVFGHGSKSNLPHLREIDISECETVGIIAAVTSPPPHPLPFFPSLEQISIRGCDKMKRAVESEWMPHFPNLRRITAFNCAEMEEIIGGPPPYSPDEQISLESLKVSLCHNMRKLLTYKWLLHLRNLQSIEVAECEGMVELISGAGQGQEGSITTSVNNTPSSFQPSSISLPKLECLTLRNLLRLKSIYKAPISCDSMKRLDVYG
ncbi:probable disease resistance protein At4g27220 isoform X2 [Eucalyptus grandis]|uniref:probable disease resistance protein At4g27220 isoform X2 n=1 Tax=Eucalyptus grandis TaxID=71139 RepID=UPI00192E96B7|nr:probable disease resistance protein At4g27220 isoform X2 [Eucalyptus grandis]